MSTLTSDEQYFVMILFPFGPKPMVTDTGGEDPKVTFFSTMAAARAVALQSRAVVAYGAEIFHLGTGEEI